MNFIFEGIKQGLLLLFSFDKEILGIALFTLCLCLVSVSISSIIGIFLGSFIALKEFYAKKIVISFINTGMGLPPIVIGLFVMLLLARNGPFGFLNWLYTPYGIIIAQVIISTPIITALTLAAVQRVDPLLYKQIIALGADDFQATLVVLREIRLSVLAALIAGFGSIISEVGAVMLVGGNIKGQTRVLTTAVAMHSGMGNFEAAIALGLILIAITFVVNLALTFIQQHKIIRR